MSVIGTIIGILLGAILTGIVIWIIGKLRLGLEVDGFRPAYVAAVVIALLNALTNWFWNLIGYTPASGLPGAITHLILTAGFLVAAGSWIKGLRVKGFTGALLAAVIIAVIFWLITLGGAALI